MSAIRRGQLLIRNDKKKKTKSSQEKVNPRQPLKRKRFAGLERKTVNKKILYQN